MGVQTSERSRLSTSKRAARSRIPIKALRALLSRQRFRCAFTNVQLTPDNAELDHKVPICRGGDHGIENVQWVVESANKAKGTMTDDEFVALCVHVVETRFGIVVNAAKNEANED